MWCETHGGGPGAPAGPLLGIHLGMSGRIVVTDRSGARGRRPGARADGPSPDRDPAWDRFTIRFADGGEMRLFDKRRLGRVRLDPDLTRLGPDAAEVGVAEFRERVGRGTTAVKARLLDQSVIAGVGNLLADETLWQASLDPRRRVDTLDHDTLTALHASLRKATRAAIRLGGVHTGEAIEHRSASGHCPRCGAPMQRATVGGRTTWFCSQEQG